MAAKTRLQITKNKVRRQSANTRANNRHDPLCNSNNQLVSAAHTNCGFSSVKVAASSHTKRYSKGCRVAADSPVIIATLYTLLISIYLLYSRQIENFTDGPRRPTT